MSFENQWISEVTTSRTGVAVAFAWGGEDEGRVSVWNLESGSREGDLMTEFDMGGRRLAINRAGTRCAVGSWNGRSLSLYDVQTGERLWRREKIAKVDHVAFSLDDSHVYCHFDEDRLMKFHEADGEPCPFPSAVTRFRRVEEYWESPFDSLCVRTPWPDPLHKITVLTAKHTPVAQIRRKSFGFLDHAFAPEHLCVSEANGPVTCYHLRTGNERWTFDPGKGRHALKVAWVESAGCFAVHLRCFTERIPEGGGDALHLLDAFTGVPTAVHPLTSGSIYAFARSGAWVVSQDGQVMDTLTAQRFR